MTRIRRSAGTNRTITASAGPAAAWSTKSHALVDGLGRLLTLIVGPGQAGDCPVLPLLLGQVHVPRRGPGRPRTTPDSLSGDKAYSSRANRELLRARGITAVIPERADQIRQPPAQGQRRRPTGQLRTEQYQNRNVVERFFNRMKHWRGLASRFASTQDTAAASSWPPSSTGSSSHET
jgi:transposase